MQCLDVGNYQNYFVEYFILIIHFVFIMTNTVSKRIVKKSGYSHVMSGFDGLPTKPRTPG